MTSYVNKGIPYFVLFLDTYYVDAGLVHSQCDAVEKNHEHAHSLEPREAELRKI